MKNTSLIFLIGILFWIFIPTIGQAQSIRNKGLNVGFNYVNVKGKQRGKSNIGVGIYADYRLPLIKSIGLNGVAMAGIDKLTNCDGVCLSEWFELPVWWGFGLEKSFLIQEKHQFSLQARWRWFGFYRNEAMVIDGNGNVLQWSTTNFNEDAYGFKFGYHLPIKLPIELGFAHDWGTYHRQNTFLLTWQF